ncbi:hypothetical protein FDP41_001779 [Naegleria fowleri]|uniref:Uncharacterized protein n=1 Tax=Naegleria fowleri TaxID=5763 RepID=A0A6A5BVW6_NAEFO|nr:uncharacterized protein FDP41_001779 [Naegleria fowleri]KAF0979436.1 hypothetical protein FDP41_001779 [Naegleria fowleri]
MKTCVRALRSELQSMKSVPVTELEVYEKLFNIIEQFAQHQNLSFYLTRLHDELYRKMHPQTTKPYPPEVAYYWESIRFHSSERVLQLLKGNNNNSNIHVPHPDSLKNWAGPPIYGHLYTDETIKKLVTTTLEQHGSCIALISWDIVTVRPCLSYGQNGYAFGLDSGPVTHTQFLQENYSSDNFAKKAIVFQIIDLYGNFEEMKTFPNVCAVFALPNSNMFSFIMDKVREIDQKWSVHEKFCIIGSVTDGEFEPATVENFLNNNERKQWTHCEDYIHILKRLRNPLIDSSHAISMMGLIYLNSKYDNLNRKLRRSDLIVKDEMNVESCLNLMKEDVLQALQTIRSYLKEEFSWNKQRWLHYANPNQKEVGFEFGNIAHSVIPKILNFQINNIFSCLRTYNDRILLGYLF